jgi:hypothetical protein
MCTLLQPAPAAERRPVGRQGELWSIFNCFQRPHTAQQTGLTRPFDAAQLRIAKEPTAIEFCVHGSGAENATF